MTGQAGEGVESRSGVAVRVLGVADAKVAVEVLARAFEEEPAKLVMLPDLKARRTVLEMMVNARLHDPLRYGTAHGAYVGGRLAAVALWRPPGASKLSMRGALRTALRLFSNAGPVAGTLPHIVGVLLSDLPGFFGIVRERRRAVARATRGLTWSLEVLGTVPEYRGKGLARSLLERQLRRCDQDDAAVWLEATDPVNPPIYERFGFETVAHADGPKWLPGYWVMRREPGAAGLGP